jgi:bile acid-coenzyme A ligase
VIASGGTTGRPKLIITEERASIEIREDGEPDETALSPLALTGHQVQMICTQLYHMSAFVHGHRGLMLGNHLVLLERFDARLALDAIERHRVEHLIVVPTIMHRLCEQPDIDRRDLSSLRWFWHGGAVCPQWLKRRWIQLLSPDRVWEAFGGTEAIGGTFIGGEEWLQHPGSVGRPVGCDLLILDESGSEVPAGDVGEIHMRPHGSTGRPFRYLGADYHSSRVDGFLSVGDLGWVDSDGYLYVADRRVDMIISGGANVFPAEIESVLSEHPAVADVAVIGVPDDRWGRRVHAAVLPRNADHPPSMSDLDAYCRARLAGYKVPKTYEFLSEIPRNEAGKLLRRDLVRRYEATTI